MYDTLLSVLVGQQQQARSEDIPVIDRQLAQRHPLRILLAEDNAINQKVALRILERMGYRADTAMDGIEVLEAVRRQPYDVVLMDMQMPILDGLEATRQIRQLWPDGPQPRIVAMTANAMQGDRERCLEAGMDDYVSKPVRIEELARVLRATQPVPSKSDTAQAVTASAEATVLNPKALENLSAMIGGDEKLIADLLQGFLNETPDQLKAIAAALAHSNAEEMHRLAHTLKSTSAMFGMARLSRVAADLEDTSRSGQLDGAADLVETMYNEFERGASALHARLGVGPP